MQQAIINPKQRNKTMAAEHITRDAVRNVLRFHLGIRANEVAVILQISKGTAQSHIKAIRAEWQVVK
tara:strand:+ start:127 stop:327 length:201 start_codon:yes stop_codon:yes gene_type:complete